MNGVVSVLLCSRVSSATPTACLLWSNGTNTTHLVDHGWGMCQQEPDNILASSPPSDVQQRPNQPLTLTIGRTANANGAPSGTYRAGANLPPLPLLSLLSFIPCPAAGWERRRYMSTLQYAAPEGWREQHTDRTHMVHNVPIVGDQGLDHGQVSGAHSDPQRRAAQRLPV